MSHRVSDARPGVVVLSWHPPEPGSTIAAGGFRRALELLARFKERCDVVVIDARPTIFPPDGPRLRVVGYPMPRLRPLSSLAHPLVRAIQWAVALVSFVVLGRRELRGHPERIVYVPTSEILACTLGGALLKALTGCRLVLCNQNVDRIPLAGLTMRLHDRADLVTTISKTLADSIRARGVRTEIFVNRGAPPVVARLGGATSEQKRWDAIFIGRHRPEKGILDVLDVWELVRRRRPGATLALVGTCAPDMERVIAKRCESPALRGGVVRLGALPEDEKLEHLQRSRVLVHPSRVEGWGLVPQEAVAAGVPALCWDLPVYRESMPPGPGIRFVETGDVDAFAAALLSWLEEGDEHLSSLAAATAPSADGSWDDVAEAEMEAVLGPIPRTLGAGEVLPSTSPR